MVGASGTVAERQNNPAGFVPRVMPVYADCGNVLGYVAGARVTGKFRPRYVKGWQRYGPNSPACWSPSLSKFLVKNIYTEKQRVNKSLGPYRATVTTYGRAG